MFSIVVLWLIHIPKQVRFLTSQANRVKNLIGISICIDIYIPICINNCIKDVLLDQSKRQSYRTSFKLATVEEVEAAMHPDEVAQNYNVSRSNVIK